MLRNVLGEKLNVSRVWIRKIINFDFFFFRLTPWYIRKVLLVSIQGWWTNWIWGWLQLLPRTPLNRHLVDPEAWDFQARISCDLMKNNFEKKIHSKPQSIIEQNESSTPHIHTYTIKILSRKAFWYYIILK